MISSRASSFTEAVAGIAAAEAEQKSVAEAGAEAVAAAGAVA